MNLYEILNIESNSTPNQIKKAYFKLAKKYHPDKNNDNVQLFHKINYAYNVLINEETRCQYDKMNNIKKSSLHSFLEKIFNSNLKTEELKNFGIDITNDEFNYVEDRLSNFINQYNFTDIFKLFSNNIFIKKQENDNVCSDNDTSKYTDEYAEYYSIDELPIKYQKMELTGKKK